LLHISFFQFEVVARCEKFAFSLRLWLLQDVKWMWGF